MTSREDSVLRARDPSLVDENDWEEFSLSEVRILVPGKSRYANLLTASPENPVQVTGCLEEVEEEQECLVLDPDYLTKRIVLDDVGHFAYGQHNDGEVGIWVAGRAGWFSISPAKGYRPMFNEVVEAIDLLYFLTDRHKPKRNSRRRRKSWASPSLEYLCDEYVLHTHGICEDGDDSLEVFHKHHNFLMSRMIRGEEDVNWAETSIFAHLCEKFPEDYEELRAQKESRDAETEEEDNHEDELEDEDVEMETRATTPDPTAVSKAQADAIYQIILDLKEAGYLAKRQLNLELVTSTLMARFEIDELEYAQNFISTTAATILESLNKAKTNTFDWSKKVIYRELKAASKKITPVNVTFTPLRPRITEDDGTSDEESEHEQPKQRRPRHRKSVLRPKSQIASKRTGKRARSTTADYDLSDDNQDAMDEFETPTKVRGHDLVRDPLSTTRAKRRTRSILSDPESTPFIERTPLQETLQSRNTSVSAAEPVPDTGSCHDTNLPVDTWVCKVPGCDKVITKCTSKRGKEQIQDHSLAHADDTKAKLELVEAEKKLNVNFRVDNLLSRIRDMGTLDGALAALNGETNGAQDEDGT
ncbi:hypothetical protein BDW72DRAFT_155067 [Aspergillus terricola var. indicus]